jgi:hypothetical protein
MKYPNLELIEYITENTANELFEDILIMSTYHKFKMYVFPQTWSSTALGFDGCGGQAITEAYTTVVEMSWDYINKTDDIRGLNLTTSEDRIYAVFFDSKFAYMYLNPSKQFFKNLDKRNMRSQRGSQIYDEDYTGNERLSF